MPGRFIRNNAAAEGQPFYKWLRLHLLAFSQGTPGSPPPPSFLFHYPLQAGEANVATGPYHPQMVQSSRLRIWIPPSGGEVSPSAGGASTVPVILRERRVKCQQPIEALFGLLSLNSGFATGGTILRARFTSFDWYHQTTVKRCRQIWPVVASTK